MPLSMAIQSMRKHYDPYWKMNEWEDDGKGEREFTVHCEGEIVTREYVDEFVTVKAWSEDEAKDKALDIIADAYPDCDDFDVDAVSVQDSAKLE